MKLSQLVESLDVRVDRNPANDVEITDLVDDSRRATPGCAFVARQGSADDGQHYINDALKRGAAAILIPGSDPRIVGQLAERFFDHPGQKLKLIAVTGTNGKSTIGFLIQHLLACANVRCGLIGTVIVDDGQTRTPAELTTPGPIDFSRYLAAMVANECQAAVCEVSSHALHQGRTEALDFDVAVFTNLTGDHLDYHETMTAYADAKALLFASLHNTAWAILHRDDAYAQRMVRDCHAQIWWTTLADQTEPEEANVCHATITTLAADHSHAIFAGPWGSVNATLPLTGRHNVANTLQAIAAANCITAMARQLRYALPKCPQVPGRLERVTPAPPPDVCHATSHRSIPNVLVDYAHTHDSLENVLLALQPITHEQGGKLICLFGCGGDRDKTKRPKMAAIACQLADTIIITSDNPRSEDPQTIINDIMVGVPNDKHDRVVVIIDRAQAIQQAIQSANAHDTVLLAGKGHETYQIISTPAPDPENSEKIVQKIHFDDREHAANALTQWMNDHADLMVDFWTADAIARLLHGQWINTPDHLTEPLSGVSIDTRTIKPNNIFVAIPGENFDGHNFTKQAIEQGAIFTIVEREITNTPALRVDNTIAALQILACAWRDELAKHDCKVIAITGSNGKTSTRHLVHHLLSATCTGSQSPKSFNNHLGVPLTLLAAKREHDFVVAEVGTNHPGEIAALAEILRPDAAIITTLGSAHLGQFGSLEAIEREKRSLYHFVKPAGLKIEPNRPPEKSLTDQLPLPHVAHQARNAQAAIEVARWMGLEDVTIAKQLATVTPIEGRLQVLQFGQNVAVIHDAYNANPDSARVAIEFLLSMQAERHVLVLGDMFELGEFSDAAHQEIGDYFREQARKDDLLITLGSAAAHAQPNCDLTQRGTHADDLEDVITQLQPGDTVLLKGSRGMRLERLLPLIKKRFA